MIQYGRGGLNNRVTFPIAFDTVYMCLFWQNYENYSGTPATYNDVTFASNGGITWTTTGFTCAFQKSYNYMFIGN